VGAEPAGAVFLPFLPEPQILIDKDKRVFPLRPFIITPYVISKLTENPASSVKKAKSIR
jgi:hypothetical protein